MNKFLLLILLAVTLGSISCETDIDVNADYQDIPIVYGIINPNDDNHYIKINKAFLGATNAYELAANPENFNYADGELEITVQEFAENGSLVKTFSTTNATGPLAITRTVNEIPKDPGIFANSSNVLYKFVEPDLDSVLLNKRNSIYKLKIVNTLLNKEITAETNIVGASAVAYPGGQNKLQFHNGVNFLQPPAFTVNTGLDVGRVELSLIFHYTDYFTTSSGLAPIAHIISMPLGEKITGTTQSKQVEWTLKGEEFYQKVIDGTPSTASIPFLSHREVGNFSLEIDIAGSELSTFMAVSAPSTSINQEKPSYTNITNGLGIFSSREKQIWTSSIIPATGNINLQTASIKHLKTLGLGFCFGVSPTSGHMCNQLP